MSTLIKSGAGAASRQVSRVSRHTTTAAVIVGQGLAEGLVDVGGPVVDEGLGSRCSVAECGRLGRLHAAFKARRYRPTAATSARAEAA